MYYTAFLTHKAQVVNFQSELLCLSLFSFEMQRTPRKSNPDEEVNMILPQTPVRYDFSYF